MSGNIEIIEPSCETLAAQTQSPEITISEVQRLFAQHKAISTNSKTIHLTERQAEVLLKIVNGKTAKEISSNLRIEVREVDVAIAAIYKQLNVHTKRRSYKSLLENCRKRVYSSDYIAPLRN